MIYLDVHTHHIQPGARYIYNIHRYFNQACMHEHLSAGLHPWYLTSQWDQELDALSQLAVSPQVLAIGECGLDKRCKTPLPRQQAALVAQMHLAQSLNKPVIIHCVGAYAELLQLYRQFGWTVPLIFHGFRKKIPLALEIIRHGHYLSFGDAIFKPGPADCLQALTLEQVFLETDDSPYPISAVYNQAAHIKNIPVEMLSLQLQKNWQKIFSVC